LFADINGFTTISEMLEPETLVRWLSSFMDAMTSLIERHNGVIDRLAGDCVMALFGPPIVRQHLHEIETDAIEAVRYAVSMSQTLLELNRTYRAEGLPEIRIGIGIHSGELVSCCLGSAKRQQYTTIGDTANTAARLMTVAKEYMKKVGSDDVSCVALSDATRALLGGAFNLHALGPVMCKGKKDPIACYLLHSEGHCKPQSPRNL
jgi:adenylate cyclase